MASNHDNLDNLLLSLTHDITADHQNQSGAVIPETFPLPGDSVYSGSAIKTQIGTQIPETFPLPDFQDDTFSSLDDSQITNNVIGDESIITNGERNIIQSESNTGNKGILNYPVNKTLISNKENNTIVFRQLNDINNNTGILTLDPIGIAKSFERVLPGDISDIRINRRRNIVAVELKNSCVENLEHLKNIKQIGKFTVQGYNPSDSLYGQGATCSGVISPIGFEDDLEEIRTLLTATAEPVRITRLSKYSNGKKEDSFAIKIDFRGKVLPEKIKLGHISYLVKKYNPPPLRCFQCQRLGHMAGGCTSPQRCLICSGNHKRTECPNQNSPKCANCGEKHVASNRTCVFNRKARDIEILTGQGKSLLLAKQIVDSNYAEDNVREQTITYTPVNRKLPEQNTSEQTQDIDPSNPTPQIVRTVNKTRKSFLYNEALKRNIGQGQQGIEEKNYVEKHELKDIIKECMREMFANLKSFFLELFSEQGVTTTEKQFNIITSATKNLKETIVNEHQSNEVFPAFMASEQESGVLSSDVENSTNKTQQVLEGKRKRKISQKDAKPTGKNQKRKKNKNKS